MSRNLLYYSNLFLRSVACFQIFHLTYLFLTLCFSIPSTTLLNKKKHKKHESLSSHLLFNVILFFFVQHFFFIFKLLILEVFTSYSTLLIFLSNGGTNIKSRIKNKNIIYYSCLHCYIFDIKRFRI